MSDCALEQLPDEILLEICIYLKAIDIWNSFGQLNQRLERTISHYRRTADLHHLTLRQFRNWFDHLLVHTADSIVNLVVSNWNSPGQIVLFNRLTSEYASLRAFLPNLKQLRIIDMTNDDVEILSKLDKIERLLIDADALLPLTHSNHILLDKYLFCSSHHFKEIRLWGVEGGIRLQHHVTVSENLHLERLTISVAVFDDLFLTFRRAPNLVNCNIEVVQQSSKESRQCSTSDLLPKHMTFFHFQTSDPRVLSLEDLDTLVGQIPTIELLSLDMDTSDLKFTDGSNWQAMLSNLPKLRKVIFKLRVRSRTEINSVDIETVLESFAAPDIPICCYIDQKTFYVDTVPYQMQEFGMNMSVTTSPCAHAAKTTHFDLHQQPSRRVQTLIVDGQHEPSPLNHWLSVINRFAHIEILQLNAVNIALDEQLPIELAKRRFRLPRLTYLHYVRSTGCKVNLPFFMFLVNDASVSSRLKCLSMMYGDIVYLCKRLSNRTFDRIRELRLYASDADGHVIVKDIDLLLRTFPRVNHFFFNNQSSRLINRHLEAIIEKILRASPTLISFRISCNRGSLSLPRLIESDINRTWVKQFCGLDDDEQIHLSVNKKSLAIWK